MTITGAVEPANESPPPPRGTMRRDLLSAYAAAGAKVGSWALVTALLFPRYPDDLAMLALVRATIGLLNYTTFGLAPAMIRGLADATGKGEAVGVQVGNDAPARSAAVYANGFAIAIAGGLVGLLLLIGYALLFPRLHHTPAPLIAAMPIVVLGMGVGTLLRLLSEPASAVIQTRGRIAADNSLSASAEVIWVSLSFIFIRYRSLPSVSLPPVAWAALAYVVAGVWLLAVRMFQAGELIGGWPQWNRIRGPTLRGLLSVGSFVFIAQLADFLYAPTDFILINRFLPLRLLDDYTPAVQIDSGLLLLVGAMANVLLPRAALSHAQGRAGDVRRYYLRGTLASLGVLSMAAVVVWAASPWLFRLWLGSDMPLTRAILPLVLVHTVVGGSGAVGRSVLLAVGRAKAFAVSVLVAGVANVILSYVLAVRCGWGLRGIVLGTVTAAVGRCALWMPWYVMLTLRRLSDLSGNSGE